MHIKLKKKTVLIFKMLRNLEKLVLFFLDAGAE